LRAAILLAAGQSRRFGSGDKLKAVLGRASLFSQSLKLAQGSGAVRVIVVGGPRVRQSAALRQVRSVRSREGIGESLSVALAALRPIEREVIIYLADMPLARLPNRITLRSSLDAVRPIWKGERGHPVLIRSQVARNVLLRCDRGLGVALARCRLAEVQGQPGNVLDIDTPAALRRLRRAGSHASRRRC
jgi:molybdenum cofactor cytidylyltransferase